MKSAFVWFGGKANFAPKLLPLLPAHHTYVEPFGGAASLLFAKPPSPIEVYNDLDGGLVNFWRVMRTPALFEEFQRVVALTPFSREEFEQAAAEWATADDPIEKARLWYVAAQQSFSGEHGHSWSYCRTESRGGMSRSVLRWLATVERLPEIYTRWMQVQVENDPFQAIIPRYDTPETLFYCDPPYVTETRRSGKYNQEMTDEDHAALVGALLAIKGKALLSGYLHPVYEPLEQNGWRRIDFPVTSSAAGRTRNTGLLGAGAAKDQKRVECVWLSPNIDTGQMRFDWKGADAHATE